MKIMIEHGDMRLGIEVYVDPEVKATQVAQLAEALQGLIDASGLVEMPYRGPIYEVPSAANRVRRLSNGQRIRAGAVLPTREEAFARELRWTDETASDV